MRRFLAFILAGYCALLLFAAWPELLRSGPLDPASRLAGRALAAIGVRAGQPVFEFPNEREYREVAYCLYVQARTGDGQRTSLWPPGGECKRSGVRLRLPPRDTAYQRLLNLALLDLEDGDGWRSRSTLEGMGHQFCTEAESEAPGAEEVDLYLAIWQRSYRTGELIREPILSYRASCPTGRVLERRWAPDEATIRRVWRGSPWL